MKNFVEEANAIIEATHLRDVVSKEDFDTAVTNVTTHPFRDTEPALSFLLELESVCREKIDAARLKLTKTERMRIKKAVMMSVLPRAGVVRRDPQERELVLPDPTVDTALVSLGYQGFFADKLLPGGLERVQELLAQKRSNESE